VGEAIGQILPLAVGVAISPVPIIAVVLMLLTPRARVTGPAFIVGWLVGLTIVGVVVLLVAPGAEDDGSTSTTTSTIKLVIGIALVLMAARRWRGRAHDDETPPTPRWMGAIDGFTAPKAAGAGVVLSAANPKNLLLAIAAATAIAQTSIPGEQQAVVYAIFAIIGTIGVAIPVVVYVALGDRAAAVLDGLRQWMARNNAVIMAVLLLVIGAKLIGDAISGFSV
jgi:hypothetical protein